MLAGKKLMMGVACLLGLATFVVNFSLELYLDSLGAFSQYNLIFDSDPNANVEGIAHGWGNRGLLRTHFSNLFSVPIRGIARLVSLIRLYNLPEVDSRRSLALLVVPIASATVIVVSLYVCHLLGMSLGQATFIAGFYSISFSQLIFGSIPAHNAIGGLSVALSYLLAAFDLTKCQKTPWFAWFVAGFLTLGITVTNFLSTGLLLLTCMIYRGGYHRSIIRNAIFYGIVVIAFTFSTAFLVSQRMGNGGGFFDVKSTAGFVSDYLTDYTISENLNRSLTALINSIAPVEIGVVEDELSLAMQDRYLFRFTLEGKSPNLFGLISLVLVFSGLIGGIKIGREYRLVSVTSMVLLVTNLVMHCFFGSEFFLYSQHWMMPLLLIIGGNLSYFKSAGLPEISIFMVLFILIAVSNAVNIFSMLNKLSG